MINYKVVITNDNKVVLDNRRRIVITGITYVFDKIKIIRTKITIQNRSK